MFQRETIAAGRRAVPLCLALACVACADGAPGHTFEVVDEDGVSVAVSSAVPKHTEELFTYEKVLEIRADPDLADSFLFRPVSFTLGDDGLYYVADTDNHRVAVFDGEGTFVHAIGSEGEGPGELQYPYTVLVQDGILTVFANKTTRFTTGGAFIDNLAVPQPPVYRSSDGLFVSFGTPQGAREDGYYYVGLRAEITTAARETIAVVESPQLRYARLEGRTRHELHFGGYPVALYGTDEILVTSGAEPVVSWYDLGGRLRRQVRIELAPQPVGDEDRALVEDRYDRLIESARNAGSEELAQTLLNRKARVEYAEQKAYWRRPLADDGGWLWLRIPVPDIGIYRIDAAAVTQPQSFRITDPRGEYIGLTDWPPEVRNMGSLITRGHLLAMIPDPVTEETIPTVYAIRSAIAGLDYPGDGQE